MPTIEQMREKLVIDEDNLDKAICEQAQLFFEVSEECALSASKRDEAKLKLDEKYAKVNLEIRDLHQGHKITEDMIKQQCTLDHRVETAQGNYLLKKLEADQWQALKDAFIQRNFMLREMASLWTYGYNTDTSITTQTASEQSVVLDSIRKRMRTLQHR